MSGLAKNSLNRYYKDFLRICQQWPIDASRSGRDFGEQIRISYDAKFKDGVFEQEKAEKTLDALMKISTNYYRRKYPRSREIAYTGENVELYNNVLSNEVQSKVEPRKTWWERMSNTKKIGERLKEAQQAEEKSGHL